MPTDQGEIPKPTRKIPDIITSPNAPKNIMEVISYISKNITSIYTANLREQAEDDSELLANYRDLGERSQNRVAQHIRELDLLNGMLGDIETRKYAIRPTVRQKKRLYGRSGGEADESFTIRFARADDEMFEGPDKAQTQLSLHTTVTAPENYLDALYGEGLKGKSPQTTLENLLNRASMQRIVINTVGAYIDPLTGRVRIDPNAGFVLSLAKGQVAARVGGISYIGGRQHTMDLGVNVSAADFTKVQTAITELAKPSGSNANSRQK